MITLTFSVACICYVHRTRLPIRLQPPDRPMSPAVVESRLRHGVYCYLTHILPFFIYFFVQGYDRTNSTGFLHRSMRLMPSFPLQSLLYCLVGLYLVGEALYRLLFYLSLKHSAKFMYQGIALFSAFPSSRFIEHIQTSQIYI